VTDISITGGDKMAAYFAEIAKNLATAKTVRVGFLDDATYPDGTSVPMVAAIQEFGAPGAGIPPRPYFRTMVAAKKKGWPVALSTLLPKHGYNASQVLDIMGEGIAAQLRRSITDTNEPKLSPVTIMLRKMRSKGATITGRSVGEAARRVAAGETAPGISTKPLVDTGQMQRSAGYEVE
jgi:hypothetical protein